MLEGLKTNILLVIGLFIVKDMVLGYAMDVVHIWDYKLI